MRFARWYCEQSIMPCLSPIYSTVKKHTIVKWLHWIDPTGTFFSWAVFILSLRSATPSPSSSVQPAHSHSSHQTRATSASFWCCSDAPIQNPSSKFTEARMRFSGALFVSSGIDCMPWKCSSIFDRQHRMVFNLQKGLGWFDAVRLPQRSNRTIPNPWQQHQGFPRVHLYYILANCCSNAEFN